MKRSRSPRAPAPRKGPRAPSSPNRAPRADAAPAARPAPPRRRPAQDEAALAAERAEVPASRAVSIKVEGEPRAGFVAIIGRPNVGKSTLLNAILGEKLAATTPRPQTTRRRFRGILTLEGAQLVLVDTPGLFDGALLPDAGKGGFGELGTFMAAESRGALGDVDAVIWVEDVTTRGLEGGPTPVQEAIGKLVKDSGRPCVLALNKVDAVPKGALLPMLARWAEVLPFASMVPVSARRRDGLEQLVTEAVKLLPTGPELFPSGDLTDANERFICEEFIREKVMMLTGEEVPYAAAVEVLQFDESRREEAGKRGGVVEIDAAIHVEREGQKAILVGKGGTMIKEIGTRARQSLERFLGCRVMLRLHVKVSERWTRSRQSMRSLGYA